MVSPTKKTPSDRKPPRQRRERSTPIRPTTGPTSAAHWKRGAAQEEDVRVPSGNVARVRRVGPEAFLSSGKIPNVLMPAVDEAIKSKRGLRPEKATELVKDHMPEVIAMVDAVLASCTVEPPVKVRLCTKAVDETQGCSMPRIDEVHGTKEGQHEYRGEDDAATLYADEVSLDDKFFIFNVVTGGTRDLQRFREQLTESMAAVDASATVEGTTE